MRINSSGNVGIGTAAPSQKLDVRGSIRIGDGSSSEQDILFSSLNGEWQVGSNTAGNGTNSNQFYIWDSAYRLTVQKGTGNVGIGTSTPGEKLHVMGSIKLTNGSGSSTFTSATSGTLSYTLPSSYGSANDFLQSDGSGGLTWAAASGGGGSSSLNGLSDCEVSGSDSSSVYLGVVPTNNTSSALNNMG